MSQQSAASFMSNAHLSRLLSIDIHEATPISQYFVYMNPVHACSHMAMTTNQLHSQIPSGAIPTLTLAKWYHL